MAYSTAHAFSASNQKHGTQQLLGTMMTPTQSPGAGYRDDEGTSMGDEEQQDLISPPRPVGGPRQRRNFNEVTNKLLSVDMIIDHVSIRWQVLTLMGHCFANFCIL
jgi:hypothetical protein